MSLTGRNKAVALAGMLILAGSPAATGFAAEIGFTDPRLSYELSQPPVIADESVAAKIHEPQNEITSSEVADSAADRGEADGQESAKLDPELECMAKVVHREAGNQSRKGQLAVAQLVMNRIESGRFANTVCGVANQPRQFFKTASYNPRRDTAQWRMAVSVAREALADQVPDVVPGAMFYHASYIAPNSWFRTRQRVATLGDHIFYR